MSKWHTRKTIIYWFLFSFSFFKKSLHSLSTADKISKSHLETAVFGLQSFRFFLSDFFFTILHLNQGRTGFFFILYKLCKNLINTKSQKNTVGWEHQQKKRKTKITWCGFHVTLYYCTEYTHWSFVCCLFFLTYAY